MRIAVVSDVHSNLPALEAVLAAMGDDVDELWALGDIVGYGAEPDAVIDRLRGAGVVAVRGNHDHVAAGHGGADWFNEIARYAVEWTARTLSIQSRDWLATLPTTRQAGGWQLVHGSPRDPLWEYIEGADVAAEVMPAMSEPRVAFGHTHVPVAFVADDGRIHELPARDGSSLELDDRPLLLNPGSVGQPRDGDPRASYMIIDVEAARVTWQRVVYDVATAARRIRAAGLPDRLAARLSFGV
jgi:diadenosine tetraphosphatase ApaH/serine/threonine PP2A family protein phosphatase